MNFECPYCDAEIPELIGWDTLGATVQCLHCGKCFEASYDETYDTETGEEYGWFYLDPKM